MSDDLRTLYQEVILDHYKRPRNFGALDEGERADGYNPLCGDRVQVYVKQRDGKVEAVSFEGSGCAISTASASLMTEAVEGLTCAQARELGDLFHASLVGSDPAAGDRLGKLEVLRGVREYPVRIKCATLAWHAFRAALDGHHEPVSTEGASAPSDSDNAKGKNP